MNPLDKTNPNLVRREKPPLPPKPNKITDVAFSAINQNAGRPGSKEFKAVEGQNGQTKEKTENVAKKQRGPKEEVPFDPASIPEPNRKAPILAACKALENEKKALDSARNAFTLGFKEGVVTYKACESFATAIAFHERRGNSFDVPAADKQRFQKEIRENRQILFAKFSNDVKLRLSENSASWEQALPACKAILAGTAMIINASGLPLEKQEAITSKIETAVVKTLVDILKRSIPRTKEGFSGNFKVTFKERMDQIKTLKISHSAKESALKQIAEEVQSRKAG